MTRNTGYKVFDTARHNLNQYLEHPSMDSDVCKVAGVQAILAVAEAVHDLADAVRDHQDLGVEDDG